MAAQLHHLQGGKVLAADPEGPAVRTDRDAVDLIGAGMEHGAAWVAVPAARLGDDFFRLETRIAGEAIQKFVNYQMRLAVVGDLSAHLARSKALRDFVYESNRGEHVWFVDDMDALERKLVQAPPQD